MISESYLNLLQDCRKTDASWGSSGHKHVTQVWSLVRKLKVRTILDFGSGTGSFGREFESKRPEIVVTNYDPSFPEYAVYPTGIYDVIVATHSLEHVEPDFIEATLEHFKNSCTKLVYIVVPHGPARKVLTDGRNAHLIQKSAKWWFELFSKFWPEQSIRVTSGQQNSTYIIRVN